MTVERWDPQRDGPLSEAALRAKLAARGYRAARYVYPSGTYFPPHTHEVDKIDAVLAGRFAMTIAGERFVLQAGDLAVVPAGVVHDAEVLGAEAVVSLDAVRVTPPITVRR